MLVYEWINNGYFEKEAKHVAVLSRVISELGPTFLPPELDYAMVSICIALFHCMVYHSMDIQSTFLFHGKKTKKEIIDLMNTHNIETMDFEFSLNEQRAKFSEWVKSIKENHIISLIEKIKPILQLRVTIINYHDVLDKETTAKDELRLTRMSVIQSLIEYLQDKTSLTEKVNREIALYIDKIRELGPQKFEEEYLNSISPISERKKILHLIIYFGSSLFSSLLAPTKSSTTDSNININRL